MYARYILLLSVLLAAYALARPSLASLDLPVGTTVKGFLSDQSDALLYRTRIDVNSNTFHYTGGSVLHYDIEAVVPTCIFVNVGEPATASRHDATVCTSAALKTGQTKVAIGENDKNIYVLVKSDFQKPSIFAITTYNTTEKQSSFAPVTSAPPAIHFPGFPPLPPLPPFSLPPIFKWGESPSTAPSNAPPSPAQLSPIGQKCPKRLAVFANAGPYPWHGFCWYLGVVDKSCDNVCKGLGGANLATFAQYHFGSAKANKTHCSIESTDPEPVAYWYTHGNPNNWNSLQFSAEHNLGYGISNSRADCHNTEGARIQRGSYPGESATALEVNQALACPCFHAIA